MKKYFAIVILIFAVVFASSITVFATQTEPVVDFNGITEDFTFNNVSTAVNISGETVPDLFVEFKSIIPGDELTQNIVLTISDIKDNQTVKIYLKSELENDDYTELLDSINLTVKSEDEDITENLSDNILLGTFTQDEMVDINLELDIPTSVGNEISNLNANIDWVFTAQVIEDIDSVTTPTQSNIPQTGDTSNVLLWIFIAIVSSVSVIIIKRK